ncbi:MAG: hypothetical protein NZ761_12305, partial [Dehalococcoidia bacterium]|nr:hypothetical protein [Dehalococcoidia bacterium]
FASLFFEFDYPDGLSFTSGISDPPGVSCTDNVPAAGVVRCDYGAVVAGALVPLRLTFAVADGAVAVTAPSQARMRAGVSDGQPDAADGASGDDRFLGAGTIAASSTLGLGVTYSRSGLFEGAALTATIRLTNADSSPTGDFDLAVPVTNGTVLDVECTAPAGSLAGTAQLAPVASCSGAQLAPGHSLDMRLVIVAADTNDGADLLLDITAPALGIEDRTLTEAPVEVQELGLVRTSGVPAVGTPVVVCTADVSADLAGTAAAGARQPGVALRLRGAVSGNALLQPADFTVTGPDVGGITAAADCGPAQSGVSFVPGAPGTYVVTARYNTGGTNVLSLTVAGPSATPSPSPSPTP